MLQFSALIVDSNIASRSRLKQAAHYSQDFKSVYAANNLKEALNRLHRSRLLDVVFISAAFRGPDIVTFIADAKTSNGGSDTAYVLLFGGKDNDPAKIANRLLEGADAFLVEPYSVDSVSEIAAIARQVKRKNAEARLSAAAEMLVRSAMEEIDSIALDMTKQRRSRRIRKQLREAFGEYRALGAATRDSFYAVVMRLFEHAAPRPLSNYKGASKRVKQLLEGKRGSSIAPAAELEEGSLTEAAEKVQNH